MTGRGRSQPAGGQPAGRLYLRLHRAREAVGLIVALAVTVTMTLGSDVGMLSVDGAAVTPLVRLLPIAFGIAAVMPLQPSTPDMEELDTGVVAARSWALLVGLVLLATIAVAAAVLVAALLEEAAMPLGLVGSMARAVLCWTGLALTAAAVLRPAYAWVLPGVGLVAVTLFGYDPAGEPRWWNVATQPVDAGPAWLVTTVALVVGCVAWSTTAWSRPAIHVRRAQG